MQDKKVFNNKKDDKKEKKVYKETHLTYTLGNELDKLFPQLYKPSKKKEEIK